MFSSEKLNEYNYDFSTFTVEKIIEYIHFFEKTNISSIKQVTDIIDILKIELTKNINFQIEHLLTNLETQFNYLKNLETSLKGYLINLFEIFTAECYYGKILLIEYSNICINILHEIINNDLIEKEEDDLKIALLNDFDVVKEYLLNKISNYENKNIFCKLFYKIDKFSFGIADNLSNQIISDLITIDNKTIKYDIIICTLNDYFNDYKKSIYSLSNFKKLVEIINVKIFGNNILLENMTSLEKDKLFTYLDNHCC